VTRDEDADEEEVARGRDKDHRSDVATRRLVSPDVSKRPARFSRSVKVVKLAKYDPGSGIDPGSVQCNRCSSHRFKGDVLILVEMTTMCRAETHIWQRRASTLRNEKEKDIETGG